MSESVTDPLHSATEQTGDPLHQLQADGVSLQQVVEGLSSLLEALAGLSWYLTADGVPQVALRGSQGVFGSAGDHDLRHGCLDAPVGDLEHAAVVSCSWYPPARS